MMIEKEPKTKGATGKLRATDRQRQIAEWQKGFYANEPKTALESRQQHGRRVFKMNKAVTKKAALKAEADALFNIRTGVG